MLFWPLNPIYTQIPNSPTSIIWSQTNFPSSLTTISGFLNRCFFWPLNSICTQIQTPWPWLSRVRPSFNHRWSSLRVSKTDVLLTPNANKHTHNLFFFIRPSLQSREYGQIITLLFPYSPNPQFHNSPNPQFHNSPNPQFR